MPFLEVVIGLFIYTLVGGAFGRRSYNRSRRACGYPDCFKPTWCSHLFADIWLRGVFWPLGLPMDLGMMLGDSANILSRESRTTARRARELAEARHRLEVAKLLEEENQILDHRIKENGRAAQ